MRKIEVIDVVEWGAAMLLLLSHALMLYIACATTTPNWASMAIGVSMSFNVWMLVRSREDYHWVGALPRLHTFDLQMYSLLLRIYGTSWFIRPTLRREIHNLIHQAETT